jgi:UDP-3-O-[3-hydroxymyristoyl] glucosamine N-acyltransferase
MRFSTLLSHLSGVTETTPRHLANDPDLQGAHALDQAMTGQLSFLEPGNALAAALAATGASAVLIHASALPRRSMPCTRDLPSLQESIPARWSTRVPSWTPRCTSAPTS